MPSSGTSSFQWRWDVFLSFRGEDTRFNFTDHLYSALTNRGIHTFRDDEGLERGEEIQPSLLKAIEESKVSIVVFSKNYAHSQWCLDELDKIMESRREKQQKVVPIFYHVDPSDVRRQTGSFGEPFARYGNVTEERVQRWTAALTQAGGLSGWHVMMHGYESQNIQVIVRRISEMLISRPELLFIGNNMVGINSRLEEMSSLLCMESNDVRMIGIHGIAGIGKTTLAIGIYNQIAHQFEGASFLPNAAEHRGLLAQRKLLADILGEKIARISNIDEGISLIKKTLCSRKVLIILDDVSALTQLEFLAGSRQWFGSGSRIIITSRNKHLLDVHEVDGLYEVQKLKSEEAFKLFSLYAFEADLPDDRFWELSGRALNYCDGLPLAVKVVGAYLRMRTELEWEDELLKLQTVGHREVQYVLGLSYDRLEHTEKDLFLDIACFFRGKDSDSVGRILDSCNFSAIGMKVLKDCSLISILDNKIEMITTAFKPPRSPQHLTYLIHQINTAFKPPRSPQLQLLTYLIHQINTYPL